MVKELFGKKIGMTQIFNSEGKLFPVTLVEIEPSCVLEKITRKDKELARVGCFELPETKAAKIKKPQQGYFKKIGSPFFRVIKEVEFSKQEEKGSGEAKVEEESQATESKDSGKEGKKEEASKPAKRNFEYFGIEIFNQGEKITVRAKSKGKGFAGVIKRHGTKRQPSSHGSGMHRRVGSVGASATPSRIMKNKKMPGHLGQSYAIMKNLEILSIDNEKKVIFIKGSIPGSRGTVLRVIKQSNRKS